MGKTRQILSTCFFSSKNIKNVHIINNDGEHTIKIEDRASSLQLFSYNREADSRIWLQTSKSRANCVVVLKNIGISLLLIHSHFAYTRSKDCVLKYDKNRYANLGTICKYLRNTIITVLCDHSLWCNFVYLHKWKN